MQGKVNIKVDEATNKNVGVRKDIWSGNADSVYSGIRSCVEITAVSNNVEIATAGGICSTIYDSFRITPEEVDNMDVGSNVTKSHRKI